MKCYMGIDNSTDNVGVGVLDHKGNLIHYECIHARDYVKKNGSDPDDEIERISYIKSEVDNLIKKYNPDVIGLEDTTLTSFGGKSTSANVGVLKKLTKSLGVLENMFFENDIAYMVIGVGAWRKGKIDAKGRIEKKKQAIEYVNKKYGLELLWKGDTSKFNQDDIAEAIMIAEYVLKKMSK